MRCPGPGGGLGRGRVLRVTPAHAATGRTVITIDGHRLGLVFDGVGAISGGGGIARLLIDYPQAQRTQILNYLFGPGGASLQLLKLEIGGDAAASDGAEPSVERARARSTASRATRGGWPSRRWPATRGWHRVKLGAAQFTDLKVTSATVQPGVDSG